MLAESVNSEMHASAAAATAPGVIRTEHLMLRFSSGASTLDARARLALDTAIPAARLATKILIVGRTDSVGSITFNQAIALSRAKQVREYLRVRLKDVDNIAIDARGACCFLANNDTPEGRKANRRVEVVFIYQG